MYICQMWQYQKAQIETISEDFLKKWSNVLHDAKRKLVKLLLDETKLIQQQLENKFDNELITNFPENHTDIKNEIINRNFTLKITLNERRKKKWKKFKRRKRVIRTPRKQTKVSDFVEVALERSKYVNVTDNRKQRKRTTRDLQQQNTEKLPVSNSMNAFSPREKFVAEDQQNTNVTLSEKTDHTKNNSPIKNNANNTMLLSDVVFFNVTDQRIESNFSCDPTENACNVLKEVTF